MSFCLVTECWTPKLKTLQYCFYVLGFPNTEDIFEKPDHPQKLSELKQKIGGLGSEIESSGVREIYRGFPRSVGVRVHTGVRSDLHTCQFLFNYLFSGTTLVWEYDSFYGIRNVT